MAQSPIRAIPMGLILAGSKSFPWLIEAMEPSSAPFSEWDRGKRDGGNHATHHLLRPVDRHLDMLDGQRDLGSELWRPQLDAGCRWMRCILHLKCGSGRRTC